MLFAFDLDGTLIEGFMDTTPCEECGGEGRLLAEDRTAAARALLGQTAPAEGTARCEPCKGKGFKFGKEPRNYDTVEVLPRRLEKLEALAAGGHSFAIATNQGGVAMGYQSLGQVERKLSTAVRRLRFFFGQPFSVHYALHHADAKVAEWLAPEGYDLRKPGPGMLRQAMNAHFCEQSSTVFVGDLATDRDAAEAIDVAFEWSQDFFGDR